MRERREVARSPDRALKDARIDAAVVEVHQQLDELGSHTE